MRNIFNNNLGSKNIGYIDDDSFSIDEKNSDKLEEYKKSDIKYVAIGDMGLMPIDSENKFEENKTIMDSIAIYSSFVKPKVKQLTLKK